MVCNKCGNIGHNSRTYMSTTEEIELYSKQKTTKKHQKKKEKKKTDNIVVNLCAITYCLFDFEMNGLGKHFNDIIEMYALFVNADDIATTYPPFYSKCKPMRGVGYTQKIHGISDKMLVSENFST